MAAKQKKTTRKHAPSNKMQHSKKSPSKKRGSISQIGRKLDRVLDVENTLLREERKIEQKEEALKKEEDLIARLEKKTSSEENIENRKLDALQKEIKSKERKEESELEKLERLEREIKQEVGEHPLAHITHKDVIKGLVGAFIGLAVHYTFTYGVEIAEKLSVTRATFLFPFTFIVGLLFIYATGFRKVKDPKLLIFMPVRLIVLYVCALLMSVIVLYLFYPEFGHDMIESYKMVAGVMLAAVVGACTADLFGKE